MATSAIEVIRDAKPDIVGSPEQIEELSTDEKLDELESRKNELLSATIQKIEEARELERNSTGDKLERIRTTLARLLELRNKLEARGAERPVQDRALDLAGDIGKDVPGAVGGLSGAIGSQFKTAGKVFDRFETDMKSDKNKGLVMLKAGASLALPTIGLVWLYKKFTGKKPDDKGNVKPTGLWGKIGKGLLALGFTVAGVNVANGLYSKMNEEEKTA